MFRTRRTTTITGRQIIRVPVARVVVKWPTCAVQKNKNAHTTYSHTSLTRAHTTHRSISFPGRLARPIVRRARLNGIQRVNDWRAGATITAIIERRARAAEPTRFPFDRTTTTARASADYARELL
jgi:hypothetical protein